MFEIGQRVVCTLPPGFDWSPGLAPEYRPPNVPVAGGVYTIREVVSGSDVPGGPHWMEAPGTIGLMFEEIRIPKIFTTNGPSCEQAFDEADFMPLELDEEVQRAAETMPVDLVAS